MATWKKSISLVPPAAAAPLISGLSDLTDVAGTVLGLAETAATTASVFYTQDLDPATLAAQALVDQIRDFITDTFSSGGYKIVAHPFIPGVGSGSGAFRSLSFPNCVDVICREFDDPGDNRRPVFSSATTVEMISIIAGAPSPSLFVSTLIALNALFSLKELRLALRRMEQALKLDQVRFVRKSGSRQPDWTSWQFRDFQPVGEYEKNLLSNLAMVEGYVNAGDNIFDIAADLIARKRAQATRLKNNLATANAMFSGGLTNSGIYSLYAQAQGSQGIKNELKNATNGAGHELSFSAGVTIVAASPALNVAKEILQL
jgi:hypothetical protein